MGESLQEKIAFVTGASSGIGRATSFALAEAGANVVLFARSKEKLESISHRLGARALACPGDVTRLEDLKAAVQRSNSQAPKVELEVVLAGETDRGKVGLSRSTKRWQ